MDERIYYSLLAALLALQCQFSTFREDRHNQLQDVDNYGNQWKRLLRESSDFAQLTEMEQRSIELEEDLRRAMAEISSSTSRMQQFGGRFEELQRRLQRLQAYLRTEMKPLSRWSSLRYHEQTFLRHEKKQMKRSSPFRVRSLPNILNSSKLIDVDFEMIKKAQSLIQPISFKKKDTLEDLLETLRTRLEDLENMLENQRQAHGTMNPTQRERPPPRPTQHLRRPMFSTMDLIRTERQPPPLHLHQPAPPTVNPAQTERQPPRAHPRAHPPLRQPAPPTVNPTETERQPPRAHPRAHPPQTLHQPAPPTVNPTQTERQHPRAHPRAHPPLRLRLRQPAPPTVNPTQTERQPPRAHPPLRVRQPSDTAVGPSSAQLENQSRHSTRITTETSAPPNSIGKTVCKVLVGIGIGIVVFCLFF